MERDKYVKETIGKTDIKNEKTEFKASFKYNEAFDSNQVLYNCKKNTFDGLHTFRLFT